MRQRQQEEEERDQVDEEEQNREEDLNHRVISSESDQQTPSSTAAITKQSEEEASACTCVKCSIVYHEAKIKGTTPSEIKCALTCTRCQQKLVNCKCCSASASSTINHQAAGQIKSDRCCTAANIIESSTESECLSSTPVVNSASCSNEPKTPPSPQTTVMSNTSQSVNGSPSVAFKNELSHFESKLFNIKNELVSFQLKLYHILKRRRES